MAARILFLVSVLVPGLLLVATKARGEPAAADLPSACKLLKIQRPGQPEPVTSPHLASQPGRSLGATLELLRTQPNVPRASLRPAAQPMSSDLRRLEDLLWAYRLSPRPYQRRAAKIFARIAAIYRRELARPGLQGIAVVEGYPLVRPTARPGRNGGDRDLGLDTLESLGSGGVVVARDFVDQMATLGAALADDGRGPRVGDGKRLLKRIWRLSPLEPTALLASTRETRRMANGVLATALARESAHWVSNDHGAPGTPNVERRANLIAAQISLRLGVSPAAILAYPMWAAMRLAQTAGASPAAFVARYGYTYRYLERHLDRPRRIYGDGQRPTEGRPLMTAAMKQDLRAMPTPEELARFIRPDPTKPTLRVRPTHRVHRIHFVHHESANAPITRSILGRLGPLVRAESRAVGETRHGGIGGGTAFLVKPSTEGNLAWVMTNAHVVKEGGAALNAKQLEVRFDDGQGRTWTGLAQRALFVEPGLDAAILEVALPDLPATFAAVPLLRRPVKAREALHTIGFPGIQSIAATEPGGEAILRRFVAAPRGTAFPHALKAICSGHEKAGGAIRLIEGAPFINFDAPIYPGSSGSPVFAADGVVALLARGTRLSETLSKPRGTPDSWAVPMARILERLEQTRPEIYRQLTVR